MQLRPAGALVRAVAATLVACAPVAPPEAPRPVVTTMAAFSPVVYERVAVFVQSRTNGVSEGGLREVEDRFMQALLAKGYILASRSDLAQVLKEQKLQASGVTEKALAEAGKALNVAGVLLVSVNRLDAESYTPVIRLEGRSYYRATAGISARLISADLAQVMWIGSYSDAVQISNLSDREIVLAPVASVVASGLPRRK